MKISRHLIMSLHSFRLVGASLHILSFLAPSARLLFAAVRLGIGHGRVQQLTAKAVIGIHRVKSWSLMTYTDVGSSALHALFFSNEESHSSSLQLSSAFTCVRSCSFAHHP